MTGLGPRGQRLRRLLEGPRLARYLVTGLASLLTHLLILLALVEWLGFDSVFASTLGFLASVVVSYLLQWAWVFNSTRAVAQSFPRFLVVTGIGFALNLGVMAAGTWLLGFHYLPVQIVAFVLVPVSNYLLNGLWTFVDAEPGPRA
jgi:putative flippase GtrA